MDTEAPAVDSLAALEEAINGGDTRLSVALALVREYDSAGRHAEALALMARIAALAPRADLQRRLALMARKAGRSDVTAVALRRWAELAPDDPIARHLAAAAKGVTTPRAEADYVRELFDGYAAKFDEHLGALDYRAPALVGAAIERVAPGRRFGRAVDLGCGTGLLGVELRARIDHLDGVDLSPAMLAQARDRGMYDDLNERDLVDFLASAMTQFDLVTASDTLNYFGELAPVFQAAAAALVTGGLLAFTLERGEAQGGFRLQPSGRFVHDEPWVIESLGAAGFSSLTVDYPALRREGGADVPGLVVVAVAP